MNEFARTMQFVVASLQPNHLASKTVKKASLMVVDADKGERRYGSFGVCFSEQWTWKDTVGGSFEENNMNDDAFGSEILP